MYALNRPKFLCFDQLTQCCIAIIVAYRNTTNAACRDALDNALCNFLLNRAIRDELRRIRPLDSAMASANSKLYSLIASDSLPA